jgi:hypothetical protein
MVSTVVAPESGSGTPSGDVAILTDTSLPANQGQGFITLSNGAGSQTLNYFPGGTYQVTGQYGGDGVYGVSTSPPVTLSVLPENSNVNFVLYGEGGYVINPAQNANTGFYGQPVFISVQPTGVSAATGKTDGNATGSVTFTLDSVSATLPLNAMGVASWTSPNLAVGTHTANATYSGDASFKASSANPITFSVAAGQPFIQEYPSVPAWNMSQCYGRCLNAGSSLTVSVFVGPLYGEFLGESAPLGTVAPTGTATVCLGPWRYGVTCFNPNYEQTVPLVAPSGYNSQYSSAAVTFPNLAAGFYYLTIYYSGDANWQAWGLVDLDPFSVNSPATPLATTTTLAVTPSSISGTQTATFSGTVTGAAGSKVAPTGTVTFFDNGVTTGSFAYYPLVPAQSGTSATFSVTGFPPASFWNNGANQITAVYSGDTNYLPSTSIVVTLNVTQSGGDFMLTPQLPQVTLQAGSSGTVGVNLTSLYNFSAVVNLTCAPSSNNLTCSVNPPSLTVNGAATAMVTINASVQAAGLHLPRGVTQALLPVCGFLGKVIQARAPLPLLGAGCLLICVLVLGGLANNERKWRRLLALGLFAALWLAVSCGGGGSTQPPASRSSSSSSSPLATYSVLVNGTAANGIIHNAKIIVVVQ